MDKITRDGSSSSKVTFWESNVRRLLFANNLALLFSNKSDFQYALDWFSDACLGAGMKYFFQINRVTLQQIEKFMYIGVTFLSYGRQDNELDTRIGKASAVMCQLY